MSSTTSEMSFLKLNLKKRCIRALNKNQTPTSKSNAFNFHTLSLKINTAYKFEHVAKFILNFLNNVNRLKLITYSQAHLRFK